MVKNMENGKRKVPNCKFFFGEDTARRDGGEQGGGDGGEAGQQCAGDRRMNTETNWESAANVVIREEYTTLIFFSV